MADQDNVQPIKAARTRESIRASVEGELKAARLKEVQGKLKGMISSGVWPIADVCARKTKKPVDQSIIERAERFVA